VARHDDTPETLKKKVRIAAIFGTLQASLTNFKYIREDWKKNCEEEALLGVDITGHMDCPLLRPGAPGREALMQEFKAIVAEVNSVWADRIGINRSASDTCIKPSGDSSAFFWCGSGIHAWFNDFFIRRTREKGDSPVAKMLKDAGVPWIPAPEDASLVAFEWPCKPAGEGAPTRKDMSAIEQLENWLSWKKNFAEHSVSCTVYIEPHEWFAAGQWVYEHFDDISGISFLPRDNGKYTGTPYEDMTKAEYEKRLEEFPEINWAKLMRYETEDGTESGRTFACGANGCEL
jgi:ribonucleoside-diphosphate reductase alpha chain